MRRTALRAKRTLAIVTLALASCRGPIRALSPTPEIIPIRLATTNSTTPLLQSLAFSYQPENKLVGIVNQADDTSSIEQLLFASEPPALDKPQYVLTTHYPLESAAWAAPLGQDGIAIITHPDIQIDYLTARDLRNIFSGISQEWLALSTTQQQIVVVGRESTSATRQAFEELVLGQRVITPAARLATSSQSMLDIVATTPGAIGFVSTALVNKSVHVLGIAADNTTSPILPTLENIYDEVYPLRMPLLIVGPRPPTPGDGYYEFIAWAQTDGQAIIAENYALLPKIR